MSKVRWLAASAAVAVALAGCFGTTWAPLAPGALPARGKTVLVGTIELVPPVDRNMDGGGGSLMVGPPRDRALAIFTPDRSRPFAEWESMDDKDTVWIPFDGPFFIETPATGMLYLRGLVIATNRGTTKIELDLRIDVEPADRIVYVGHLLALRVPPARVEVRDQRDAAVQAAVAAGHEALAQQPWTTRLATQSAY